MKHMRSLFVVIILACSFLSSCALPSLPGKLSEVENGDEVLKPLPKRTATDMPGANSSATETSTEQSSPTTEPTQEPTPTLTSTPTPTEQPNYGTLGGSPITTSTLNQLSLLETLGYGRIYELDYHHEAGVFIVKTELGVFLYEGESLERIAFFEDYSRIYQVSSKTQVIAVTPGKTLELIDLRTGEVIQTMVPEKANRISNIAFSQDGELMSVVIVQDHDVRLNWNQTRIDVWDLNQNKQVTTLMSELFDCSLMFFLDDHTKLMSECSPSGGGFDRIVLWKIPEGDIVWSTTSTGSFTQYPLSKDGSLFTSYVVYDPSTESSWITIWNAHNGMEIGKVSGKLSDNAFSHDSQHIITTSFDQVVVWHTVDSQRVKSFGTGIKWPTASYSADGVHILVNGGEQAWDSVNFEQVEDYPYVEPITPEVSMSQWRKLGHLDGIEGVEVMDDGQLLVWGFSENEFIWWWSPETNSYDEVSIGTGKGKPTLSPDRDQFAICTDEGLTLVDIDQKETKVFNPCRSYWNYLSFSEDGEHLYMNRGTLIDVVSVESGEVLQQLRVHTTNVGRVQTLRNGDYLISSSEGKVSGGCETIFWELNPVKFLRRWIIPVAGRCLKQAIIKQDASTLVTLDDKVSVWRMSDGWYLDHFDGTAIAFSSDDSLLAVGIQDSAINFYETDSWKLIDTLKKATDQQPDRDFYFFSVGYSPVKALRFANQGQLLVSTLYADIIQLWGLP